MPGYDDITGGLPPGWQPDPAWVPPEHWGYAATPIAPVPPMPAPPPEIAEQPAPPAPFGPQLGPEPSPGPAPPDEAAAPPAPPPPPMPTPYGAGPPPVPFGPMPGGPPGPAPIEPERLDVTPQTIEDQRARDPLRSPDPGQARAAAEGMSTADLLAQQAQVDIARQNKLLLDQARIDEDNLRELRINQEARRVADAASAVKTEQIVNDAIKLASTKTDPDRWMSTRTGGQKIAAFIAAIGGGLVQGRTGAARNAGMDAIQQHIDRDIDAQKADIENGKYALGVRSNAVAQEYARTGNLFQAAETVRLATYQAAINKMQTEQQNFDSQGTGWIRYGLGIKDMQAKAAAANEVVRKTAFDETYKVEELRLRSQAQADARRAQQQQLGLGYAQLASARADREQAAAIKRDEKAIERADKEAERERQFAVGLPVGRLQLDENGKPVVGADGKPIVLHGNMINADGKKWLVPDPTLRKELGDQINSAVELSKIYDRLEVLRERVGGESRVFNSDELQELEQLGKEALILKKKGTQGMSSDADMDNLLEVAGTKDISSFRNQSARLKIGRARTISALNTALRTANYTGPALEFPNTQGSPAGDTAQDKKIKPLLSKPVISYDEALGAEVQKRMGGLVQSELAGDGYGGLSPLYWERYREAKRDLDAIWDPDASPDQQREIRRLGESANGGDAGALEDLQKVVERAKTPKLRALAKEAIQGAKDAALAATAADAATALGVESEPVVDAPPESAAPLPPPGMGWLGLPPPGSE